MQTKRLLRNRNDRMIAGVASGIAAYVHVDPLFIRLAFLILTLMNGAGAFLYLLLWFLVPNEDSVTTDARTQVRENIAEMQAAVENLVQRIRNLLNSQQI